MSALVLATMLQVAAGDVAISEAETFARRDEASLSRALSSEFFDKQDKAVMRAFVECGVTGVDQVAGLMVVMKLDAQGRVSKTWLNQPTSLGKCFEKAIGASVLPTDGRPEFYTFVNFNF